jgi:hypothetical protein
MLREHLQRGGAAARERANCVRVERASSLIEPIPGLTVGYIGNCDANVARGGEGFDDRLWFIFSEIEVEGTFGTERRKFGGFSTENRGKLVEIASLLRAGFDMNHREAK